MGISTQIPLNGSDSVTDYSKWRLRSSEGGRHTWHYLKSEEECQDWPQTVIDKYWLGLPTGLPTSPPARDAMSAARKGFEFYKHLQDADGHWPGEYGGPMFLTPGLVIGAYVSGMEFSDEEKLEMIRYLLNRAHPVDGGWGLHVEHHSTVFGTALNYVTLRLLGVDADHPALIKARATLHKFGGATGAPQWGKWWLSVLNVYDWSGVVSMPPELWLFPEWLPFHPHRWWIHCRNVYIPMGFLYAHRFKAPVNPLILSLREELYTQKYDTINWPAQQNNVAKVDIYYPHTWLLDGLSCLTHAWEQIAIPGVRRAALKLAYQHICEEDENTGYQTLGPVNKMMNLVSRVFIEGRDSKVAHLHREKMRDFMWVCKDGMLMTGTNGSQLWDIAFISQAIVETGLAQDTDNKEVVLRALGWLDQCQIQRNPIHFRSAYRHQTKGAWPFSTKEQGYTVSDCTGEGLKAVIYLQTHLDYTPELINDRRLCDAVDTMLAMQNSDGGVSSYEPKRGPEWLEWINPAEVFGNIMVEYNYPECTTSVVSALAVFAKHCPEYRKEDVQRAMRRAIGWLHRAQHSNGGWFGSWGICFTYGTMFALESLSLAGETYENNAHVRKACEFLLSKQMADGGWGESYKACEIGEYVNHVNSQVVNTAWAGLALMYARYPHREPLDRAVALVMSRQLPDGSWAQEAIEGVFNKNCAIAYPNFKFSFTIWMLGRAHTYLANLS